jgi:hypothetical protein
MEDNLKEKYIIMQNYGYSNPNYNYLYQDISIFKSTLELLAQCVPKNNC